MLSLQHLERVWPVLLRHKATRPQRADWQQLAQDLGTSLPSDFVELSEFYPRLLIDDFLAVLCPRRGREERFVQLLRDQLEMLQDLHTSNMSHGYAPYPAEGGLLPWGNTPDGDVLYWRTVEGSPERWTIVVSGRNDDWCEFAGSITEYLAGLVSGSVAPDALPPDFPGVNPSVETD